MICKIFLNNSNEHKNKIRRINIILTKAPTCPTRKRAVAPSNDAQSPIRTFLAPVRACLSVQDVANRMRQVLSPFTRSVIAITVPTMPEKVGASCGDGAKTQTAWFGNHNNESFWEHM
jgi:hypothetical protein